MIVTFQRVCDFSPSVVVCERSREPGGAAGRLLPRGPSLCLLWSQGAVHGRPDQKHLGTHTGTVLCSYWSH